MAASPDPSSARLDGARLATVATFVALSGLTVAIVAFQPLRFAFHLPRARLPLETAGSVVAALTAGVAAVRYSVARAGAMLLVAAAFGVIASRQIVFGILLAPGSHGITPDSSIWFWSWGRILAGLLLLTAAVALIQPKLTHAVPSRLAVLAGLAAFIGGETTLYVLRHRLPRLTTSSALEARASHGALAGLTWPDLVLGCLGACLFLAVAVLYVNGRPALPRSLIGPAFVLAAFSHVHYMLFPAMFSRLISTADLLRSGFALAMVLAILTEVRRSYVAEEHRARQLAEAYQREQWHSQQLQEADQVRVAMLRVLSHELSHPVATIRSYLMALLQRRDRLDDPDLKRMIVAMEGESRDLRDLAARVDAVAHLGRQQFDVEPRPVRATSVLRSAAMLEASLGDRLAIAPADGLGEVTILADLSRIRQVFRNLLSNAAKYGGHGLVRVSAEPQDSEVVFTVADSGPGIPSEDRKWVFRQFSRLGHAPKSALGSGLGLYICQRIVEAHGGRIWVEDSESGGAAFSFTVPMANAGDD